MSSDRLSALVVEGEASESDDDTVEFSVHSTPEHRPTLQEDTLGLGGLSLSSVSQSVTDTAQSVSDTVTKHIETLSRQATRESLHIGVLRRESTQPAEAEAEDSPDYDSLLHRKLLEKNIELCRQRDSVFQEKFTSCHNELKKIEHEIKTSTKPCIEESLTSMQESVNTTTNIRDNLIYLRATINTSTLSQLKSM